MPSNQTKIDYPVDILIEILTYLPRVALFKTCMISSSFFELSLDLLYEEIYLSSVDKEIESTFSNLMYVFGS